MVQRALWLAWAVALAPPAPSVPCHDAATGAKTTVRISETKQKLASLPKLLGRRGLHILDLSDEMRARRRHLEEAAAAKDWCLVHAHVSALGAAIDAVALGEDFVSAKFHRVERWVRASALGAKRKAQADRFVADAAAALAERRFDASNVFLNQALALAVGSSDPWRVADNLAEATAPDTTAASAPEISPAEVAAVCPALAKQGRATREELKSVLTRLGHMMDERKIRPLDLEGGLELVADLESYAQLGALWPATRVACALMKRVRDAEIDLGLVMLRFRHINRLRDERGLAAEHKEKFSELVRLASADIAERKFAEAQAALEQLLVLLGEPAQPAQSLP